MAVQFILGRSGTGKTGYCIKAIVDALLAPERNYRGLEQGSEQPLILLVPEQATYQAERAILADERINGYNKLMVLSFDRLQFWVSGKNTARPALSQLGRQMIIHKILRDNKSKLKIFDSSATRLGLSRQIAQTVAELHRYAKTPEDIDQLLSELQKDKQVPRPSWPWYHGLEARDTLAALKFADIGLIFKEYLSLIEGNFLDPDLQLTRACGEVAKTDFVKDAKLWVDGFAGFTAGELAILTEMLRTVKDAQIALCLDPTEIDLINPDAQNTDPTGLFNPTQSTYTQLIDNIKKCKLHLAKPIILNKPIRFSSSPQLAHIEQNIFKTPAAKISAGNNIHIVSAQNRRSEVQFIARRILQLVREKDYRYRDIAVIASDINSYEHYIRAYFDDYNIPFFIDKRKPLNQHPVVQLINSALQVVTGGFSHHDIFTCLKTDLVPVERRDVDLLENYCLAYGIGSNDWQSDDQWRYAADNEQEFDEEQINHIRQKAISAILKLRNSLCPPDNPSKKITAEQFTGIIRSFLDDSQVNHTLGKWIEEANENGNYTAVDEHRQFCEKLMNIFEELVEVFNTQEMTCQDYIAIISSAFSQLTMAFIPPKLDEVLVGSIERSRHPDLKAAFLIGATQREFPAPVTFDTILSENDRSAVESAGFQLSPSVNSALAERQYLAYIAFTRPSELLYVTYPIMDEKGSANVHSQFIDNLLSLFDNLDEETIQAETEHIYNKNELTEFLCRRLGKDVLPTKSSDRGKTGELLCEISSDEELGELGEIVSTAINYDNRAHLDNALIRELFSKQIRSSATRLSTFADCPYKYYARYVLELKERKEFKFEPLDLGNFYHRILDLLFKQIHSEKKSIETIEDKELIELLRGKITYLIQTNSFISNFSRHSEHNAYIIRSAQEHLEEFVPALAQMVRAGDFRPAMSEVGFGQIKDSSETIGEYEFEISKDHKLSLDGKIDRIDIANIEDKQLAIVFDYKRKETLFSWSKLYYGLDMQLPIYLLAVTNAKDSKVKEAVGAFYIPVEVPAKQAALDKLSEKTNIFGYKAKGIFNGNFAQHLDKYASKDSKFYNFYVTKNGQPYGSYENKGALKPADYEQVLKFTNKKIIQLAQEILSGKIEVNPYRLNQKSPCSYCKYKSVCRFDWQINDYNPLESLNKSLALEKMGVPDA